MSIRPLDRVRSVKVKLGLLVAASVTVSALVLFYGLLEWGWLPRYTLPVAVLVALAVTQVLAHGMTSPLRELTAAAAAMARGDYSRRVRSTSRDEVGEAARAFNRMAEDLATVDRQRRELVANVSHELRTPIAALHAVLENVVDGVTPADPATLQTALQQTERLGRLVEQLLDLSRVDGGAVVLRPVEVPVRTLLDSAVDEVRMAGRAVRWVVDVEPADLLAWGDPDRLAQVVANLVDNASRHSPADGVVTVRACANGSGVRLEVSDEGPGIPAAERSRVFERFTRGSVQPTGGAAAGGGTGLGLAIARWAVDLHAGAVTVADTPSGCTIRVDLPGRAA